GQIVGGIVAETLEIAGHAAGLVQVEYQPQPLDLDFRSDRGDLVKPVKAAFFGHGAGDLLDGSPADTALGDVEAALASASASLDATYSTPNHHHNPMEPHTAIATWAGDELTLHCSTQGVHFTRFLMASTLGLDPQRVRVVSPHVGGGFGSK